MVLFVENLTRNRKYSQPVIGATHENIEENVTNRDSDEEKRLKVNEIYTKILALYRKNRENHENCENPATNDAACQRDAASSDADRVKILQVTNKQLNEQVTRLKRIIARDCIELNNLRVKTQCNEKENRPRVSGEDTLLHIDKVKILQQQNDDLMKIVSQVSMEKNELCNLNVTLEHKIQNLTQQLGKKFSISDKTHEIMQQPNAKDNDLAAHLQTLQNNLAQMQIDLKNRDEEIVSLKKLNNRLKNEVESERFEAQTKYVEYNNFHQNEMAGLYDNWKAQYNELQHLIEIKDNEMLDLTKRYSELENLLLTKQNDISQYIEFKSKYETMRIKYDAEAMKNDQAKSTHKAELAILKSELERQMRDYQILLEENKLLKAKISKIQELNKLEVSKNSKLKQKCLDFVKKLQTYEDQRAILEDTIENQILERQRMQMEMDALEPSVTQGVSFVSLKLSDKVIKAPQIECPSSRIAAQSGDLGVEKKPLRKLAQKSDKRHGKISIFEDINSHLMQSGQSHELPNVHNSESDLYKGFIVSSTHTSKIKKKHSLKKK